MGEILDEQLNVAISSRAKATLDEIRKNQRYLPAQVARGLIDAACDFYDRHQYFAFPICIEPMAWKTQPVITVAQRMAAEPPQADYGAPAPMPDFNGMEERTRAAAEALRQELSSRHKPRHPRPKPSPGR